MRVLAFEATPTRFAGGQERSLFETLSGLAGLGVEVSLAYRTPGELLAEYERFAVGCHRLESRALEKTPRGALRFAADLARAALLQRRARWDVLYANQYFDLPFAAALGAALRLPVVCHLRIDCPAYLSRQYRWGLSRCARLLANSHATKATYLARGVDAAAIEVVHNAIDVDAFRVAPEPHPGRELLFLGRIVPQKGLEPLLDAMALIAARRADVRLTIHGAVVDPATDPGYAAQLEARARALGLGDRVAFRPHLARPVDALRRADLLVLPSRWEPFGRVLLEAMAAEVPVVATRVGGIPEALEPTFAHHLVPPDDPAALAARILDLVDWRERDPGLGARARAHVSARFSRPEQLRQVRAALERSVLAPRPGRG
jgi:glycosyltransferase involved in cell wall biosynthesis